MRTDGSADHPDSVAPHATRHPSPETIAAPGPSAETIAGDEVPTTPTPSGLTVATLHEFGRAAIDLGLIDADDLRSALDALAAGGGAVAAETLARSPNRAGRLTRYQASALFQGKARALAIGPFLILDKLGSGGMGMVFKARAREGGPFTPDLPIASGPRRRRHARARTPNPADTSLIDGSQT